MKSRLKEDHLCPIGGEFTEAILELCCIVKARHQILIACGAGGRRHVVIQRLVWMKENCLSSWDVSLNVLDDLIGVGCFQRSPARIQRVACVQRLSKER